MLVALVTIFVWGLISLFLYNSQKEKIKRLTNRDYANSDLVTGLVLVGAFFLSAVFYEQIWELLEFLWVGPLPGTLEQAMAALALALKLVLLGGIILAVLMALKEDIRYRVKDFLDILYAAFHFAFHYVLLKAVLRGMIVGYLCSQIFC